MCEARVASYVCIHVWTLGLVSAPACFLALLASYCF